jgi:hypothetical protein
MLQSCTKLSGDFLPISTVACLLIDGMELRCLQIVLPRHLAQKALTSCIEELQTRKYSVLVNTMCISQIRRTSVHALFDLSRDTGIMIQSE